MKERLPDEWMEDGLCVGGTLDFFDEKNEAACAAMCEQCPVRLICRWFGFYQYEEFGMWGGWSHKDRRSYRKKNRGFRREHARFAFEFHRQRYVSEKDHGGTGGGDG